MSNGDPLFRQAHLPSKETTYIGSGGDKNRRKDDTGSMEYVQKDLLEAKLETIEARMDGRVASIEGKIDTFLAAQQERDKASDTRFSRIESDVSEIKTLFGSMKTTMIVTAITTVLAIVIGIAGFNAMLTSNMLASFQAGRADVSVQRVAIPEVKPPASIASPEVSAK